MKKLEITKTFQNHFRNIVMELVFTPQQSGSESVFFNTILYY